MRSSLCNHMSLIIKNCSVPIYAFRAHVNLDIALLGNGTKYKLAKHETSLAIQFKGNGVKFIRMKTLLIFISSALCAATASDQFSFACARKYFQNEKITDFIVVAPADAGRNELPIQSFFKSLDIESNWPVTVANDIFSAMNVLENEKTKNVILFVSSAADFDSVHANIHLANIRIFVIVTHAHAHSSCDSIFRKFSSSMQRHVVVIERTEGQFWKFYKSVDDRCSSDGRKTINVVAECEENAIGMIVLRYLSDGSPVKGKSCPLIVAAKQFEPFTYYDDIKGFYNGIDYLIVKTISERLQQDLKFIRIKNDSMVDKMIL